MFSEKYRLKILFSKQNKVQKKNQNKIREKIQTKKSKYN